MRPADSTNALVERESRLQRAVTLYIVTGLLFMLVPGTFLGVWNLISISSQHTVASLSPAWLQAHGHAQLFGWIGTFVLGIGFYSLSKMGRLPSFAVSRAWQSYALWTSGVMLRWCANVTEWHWRITLPLSAILELAGFLVFFRTVSGHRPDAKLDAENSAPAKREAWMFVVVAATIGFLITLLANAIVTANAALHGTSPAIPHGIDQRLLILPAWGFLVPMVWGFNARWLPVFLGLKRPSSRPLFASLGIVWISIIAGLSGFTVFSAALLPIAAIVAIVALHVFVRSEQPPKINGVHPMFPIFPRVAYVWLLIASLLTVWAAVADRQGGIWGASRHALTVGFLAAMVFAIGQRVLPAFCGARVLFSKTLMLASLVLLNLGCMLRVASEIPAYEGYWHQAWSALPVSAVIELVAVTLFALNLLLTFVRAPAHLMREQRAAG
jgi:uncharacterized protein involved in response to NO